MLIPEGAWNTTLKKWSAYCEKASNNYGSLEDETRNNRRSNQWNVLINTNKYLATPRITGQEIRMYNRETEGRQKLQQSGEAMTLATTRANIRGNSRNSILPNTRTRIKMYNDILISIGLDYPTSSYETKSEGGRPRALDKNLITKTLAHLLRILFLVS